MLRHSGSIGISMVNHHDKLGGVQQKRVHYHCMTSCERKEHRLYLLI